MLFSICCFHRSVFFLPLCFLFDAFRSSKEEVFPGCYCYHTTQTHNCTPPDDCNNVNLFGVQNEFEFEYCHNLEEMSELWGMGLFCFFIWNFRYYYPTVCGHAFHLLRVFFPFLLFFFFKIGFYFGQSGAYVCLVRALSLWAHKLFNIAWFLLDNLLKIYDNKQHLVIVFIGVIGNNNNNSHTNFFSWYYGFIFFRFYILLFSVCVCERAFLCLSISFSVKKRWYSAVCKWGS